MVTVLRFIRTSNAGLCFFSCDNAQRVHSVVSLYCLFHLFVYSHVSDKLSKTLVSTILKFIRYVLQLSLCWNDEHLKA